MRGTKIYAFASVNSFIESDYIDKPWNELTLREKIGKKFFKGRYFYPCVKDFYPLFKDLYVGK